ncbi:hypothetical protein Dcar01_02424 [Deinococcus carri]|uniref:Uncharacterized protein n=1 Tax=Deinococcus carri TaxID=1211323 RepID=A0ABP9WB40_9DEIO
MQDTALTLTTVDGRTWQHVPAPFPSPAGMLSMEFRCGSRRATLFKGRGWPVARFVTPSQKRLPVAGLNLPDATVDSNGNVEVAA